MSWIATAITGVGAVLGKRSADKAAKAAKFAPWNVQGPSGSATFDRDEDGNRVINIDSAYGDQANMWGNYGNQALAEAYNMPRYNPFVNYYTGGEHGGLSKYQPPSAMGSYGVQTNDKFAQTGMYNPYEQAKYQAFGNSGGLLDSAVSRNNYSPETFQSGSKAFTSLEDQQKAIEAKHGWGTVDGSAIDVAYREAQDELHKKRLEEIESAKRREQSAWYERDALGLDSGRQGERDALRAAMMGNLGELVSFDTDATAQRYAGLLADIARPEEDRARLAMENRLRAQGMLGSTGGGIQMGAFNRALNNKALAREVAAYDNAQNWQNAIMGRALGARQGMGAMDSLLQQQNENQSLMDRFRTQEENKVRLANQQIEREAAAQAAALRASARGRGSASAVQEKIADQNFQLGLLQHGLNQQKFDAGLGFNLFQMGTGIDELATNQFKDYRSGLLNDATTGMNNMMSMNNAGNDYANLGVTAGANQAAGGANAAPYLYKSGTNNLALANGLLQGLGIGSRSNPVPIAPTNVPDSSYYGGGVNYGQSYNDPFDPMTW